MVWEGFGFTSKEHFVSVGHGWAQSGHHSKNMSCLLLPLHFFWPQLYGDCAQTHDWCNSSVIEIDSSLAVLLTRLCLLICAISKESMSENYVSSQHGSYRETYCKPGLINDLLTLFISVSSVTIWYSLLVLKRLCWVQSTDERLNSVVPLTFCFTFHLVCGVT